MFKLFVLERVREASNIVLFRDIEKNVCMYECVAVIATKRLVQF